MHTPGTRSSRFRRPGRPHGSPRPGYDPAVPHSTLPRWSKLLVALCLGGCTPGTGSPTSENSAPEKAEAPPPVVASGRHPVATPRTEPSQAWVERPRSHLLLLRHTDTSAEIDVLPLRVATDPPAPLSALRVPALPRSDWPGHYVAVAAHGRGQRWVHAGGSEGAWTLVERDLEPKTPPRELPIGATIPAAMHMVGETVFIGAGNVVGTVELDTKAPRFSVLHERPDMKFKAYDLFARTGEWLVAIDDEVVPMYADAFTLDADGRATHRAGWELPGVINGHYDAAVLGRSGAGFDGTLWVVASYGIMDGHGQDLAALAIRDHALGVGPDVTLNSHVMEDPPVLEEHVSRETGKPEKLAFGRDYTPWTGLARVTPAEGPARILLAAGPRGLLLLPEGFGPTTRAEAVDVGGECADVLVDGERVLVLVAGPAPALLELRPTATGLEPGPRPLPLPEAYHRFVR
jgi:hypothetical protein